MMNALMAKSKPIFIQYKSFPSHGGEHQALIQENVKKLKAKKKRLKNVKVTTQVSF